MKKNILSSYFEGVIDKNHGESYGNLLRFFFPEYITNLLVYSVPFFLDAAFIGALSSTNTYVALSVTNNFTHLIIKIAEAFSIGTVILSGTFNGKNEYKQAGKVLVDSFWTTTILGFFFAISLYVGAPAIYKWYGCLEPVATIGIPFLRLRAVSVFCMFIFFALIGFMRGIKNTKTPMKIFAFGSILFVILDYTFIFGKFGFPALGLQGSGLASCLQYLFMLIVAVLYMFWTPKLRQYSIELFIPLRQLEYIKHLFILTFPVLLDKSVMAMAYVWLGKMIAKIGLPGIAAFDVVKNMERFAFIPAIAFAQVITFLVSNDIGKEKWLAIKNNVKKIIFLTGIMVAIVLWLFTKYSVFITGIFDQKGDFAGLAQKAFPLISFLVIFDILQIILSGALRGSGNANIVMIVRVLVCVFYFVPFSYLLTTWNFSSDVVKFVAIYGTFYIGNGIMSAIYIYWFRNGEWKKKI